MKQTPNGWDVAVAVEAVTDAFGVEAAQDVAEILRPKKTLRVARPVDACRHGVPHSAYHTGQVCVDCQIANMMARARSAQAARRKMRALERRVARLQRGLQLAEVQLRRTADFVSHLVDG